MDMIDTSDFTKRVGLCQFLNLHPSALKMEETIYPQNWHPPKRLHGVTRYASQGPTDGTPFPRAGTRYVERTTHLWTFLVLFVDLSLGNPFEASQERIAEE
jgi:hypothetical protein